MVRWVRSGEASTVMYAKSESSQIRRQFLRWMKTSDPKTKSTITAKSPSYNSHKKQTQRQPGREPDIQLSTPIDMDIDSTITRQMSKLNLAGDLSPILPVRVQFSIPNPQFSTPNPQPTRQLGPSFPNFPPSFSPLYINIVSLTPLEWDC